MTKLDKYGPGKGGTAKAEGQQSCSKVQVAAIHQTQSKAERFYAVRVGHEVGILPDALAYEKSVSGFSGALGKVFKSREAAVDWLEQQGEQTTTTAEQPQAVSAKKPTKQKFFAIRVGRRVGIVETAAEYENSINGFRGSLGKVFKTRAAAEEWLNEGDVPVGRSMEAGDSQSQSQSQSSQSSTCARLHSTSLLDIRALPAPSAPTSAPVALPTKAVAKSKSKSKPFRFLPSSTSSSVNVHLATPYNSLVQELEDSRCRVNEAVALYTATTSAYANARPTAQDSSYHDSSGRRRGYSSDREEDEYDLQY